MSPAFTPALVKRASHSALVRSRFSIDAMAGPLTRLYVELAEAERLDEAA